MHRFVLAAVLVLSLPARAADPRPAAPVPALVCVPSGVLDRLAQATAARPWVEVAPLMAELLPVLQHPAACGQPEPQPQVPPVQPVAPSLPP